MHRREPPTDLSGDFDGFFARKTPDTPQQRAEILAIYVFHRDERFISRHANVEHAADVRMRYSAGHPNLLKQAFEPRFAASDVRRKEFQCDRLVAYPVIGPVDFPHAAPSEHRHDPRALPDYGSRLEVAVLNVAPP